MLLYQGCHSTSIIWRNFILILYRLAQAHHATYWPMTKFSCKCAKSFLSVCNDFSTSLDYIFSSSQFNICWSENVSALCRSIHSMRQSRFLWNPFHILRYSNNFDIFHGGGYRTRVCIPVIWFKLQWKLVKSRYLNTSQVGNLIFKHVECLHV